MTGAAPADWSPADNPYALAVSEAQWWQRAARLGVLRLRDADDRRISWFSSRQIDARQLVFALRQLLHAERLEQVGWMRAASIRPWVTRLPRHGSISRTRCLVSSRCVTRSCISMSGRREKGAVRRRIASTSGQAHNQRDPAPVQPHRQRRPGYLPGASLVRLAPRTSGRQPGQPFQATPAPTDNADLAQAP